MSGGHAAGVAACAVSPDGAFFVSASRDNTLKLWDPETGEETRTLTGHPGEVLSCAVGHDGLIYSGGPAGMFDSVFKVWDPATGDQVMEWQEQLGPLRTLAVSPAGTFVAALGEMGVVDFRDPATGQRLGEVEIGVAGRSGSCMVTADGARVVATGGRELCVVDPDTAEHVRSFRSPDYGEQPFTLTPDANRMVFVEKERGWVIGDLSSGETRVLGGDDWFSSCSVSPDGTLVAACCNKISETWNSISGGSRTVEAASIRVRRVDSGALVHDLELNQSEALLCAFSPDGSLLLGATPDALRIWDVESGEDAGSVPLDAVTTCLVVHPSQPIAALGDAVGGFHVLDLGGIGIDRIVVTPEDRGSGLTVRCPACNTTSPIEPSQAGQDMACPDCRTAWRVNPFVLAMHTEPVRLAGPTSPEEEQQILKDKQRRLSQARNRALFTAERPEDLAALAQHLEDASGGADPALEVLRAAGGASAPPMANAPLNEQLKAMIVEEMAEAGIDLNTLSEERRSQLLWAAVSSSVLALTGKTAHLLTESQRAELMRVVTETEDPLEAVGFLREILPEFGVVDAFRAELKVACPQEAEKLGIMSDAVVHAPPTPSQPTREAPPQLTPLNEQLKAMMLEEMAEAGIDLDAYSGEIGQMILGGALVEGLKATVAAIEGRVDPHDADRLREIAGGGDPAATIAVLTELRPREEVLDEFRSGLRAAYPKLASPGHRAKMHLTKGQHDEAMTLLEEQVELSRKAGDTAGLAEALGDQALVVRSQGDLARALALHQEQEGLYREIDDRRGLAGALGNQALLLRNMDRIDEAMRLFKEMEAISREIGDSGSLARSLGNQAEIIGNQGQVETAMAMLDEAAGLSRQAEDWEQLAASLAGRGVFLANLGRPGEALEALEEAHRVAIDHGLTDLATQVEPFVAQVRQLAGADAAGPGAAAQTQGSVEDRIRAILNQELAAAGLGEQSELARQAVATMALGTSIKLLAEHVTGLLPPAQQREFEAITASNDGTAIMTYLDGALPGGQALDALRGTLQVAIRQAMEVVQGLAGGSPGAGGDASGGEPRKRGLFGRRRRR